MKILFAVHDFFPKFYGGTERYVLNLAKQMQRMGNRVEVLTYGVADPPEVFSSRGNILYRSYSFEGIPVICIRHKDIPLDHGYRVTDDLLEDMTAILKAEKPDLVHVAHPMRLSAVVNAAKLSGIPVVLTITDFWLICARGRFFKPDYSLCNSPEGGRKCRLQCGVEDSIFDRNVNARRLFDTVDVRIAPSLFLIEVFKANHWDKPIHHVAHGVDYSYVSPRQKIRDEGASVHFAYMGVVGKFKGVDLLLNSFRAVKAQNIRLSVYGNYINDGIIDVLHEAARDDDRIKIMGRFDHEDLPSILNHVDIVVVPSTTLESYGLVVIESLAYEVPVIASDIVGSAYEFIRHGENGMIFSVKNPSELAGIIEQISERPSLIESMRSHISPPPRLEEEAFTVEKIYKAVVRN